MSDNLLKKLGPGDKPKKPQAKRHSGPAQSRLSKAATRRDPLGLEKSLTKSTRQARRVAEHGGPKRPPVKSKPLPKTAGPLSKLAKAEKYINKMKQGASIFARAMGKAAVKQAAMGGARASMGRAVAKTVLLRPIAPVADALAIGAAVYTGAKAYGAHKELKRKKAYAQKHYGTLEAAAKSRRRMNPSG